MSIEQKNSHKKDHKHSQVNKVEKLKKNLVTLKNCPSQILVDHAYNLSYSGSRDQEDGGLKPTRANSLQYPISKKPITKKGWWSGSRCRP
jgi:hypothetical protein